MVRRQPPEVGSAVPPTAARILVLHPSDEMYGADRIVLQVLAAMTALPDVEVEVWLPSDVPHGDYPLCSELTDRSIPWRHRDLPVLRRSKLSPAGLMSLMRSMWSLQREIRTFGPDLVFLGTSACLLAMPIARWTGVPRRVLHIQERWSGPERRILRLLARAATSTIAISEAVAEQASLTRPVPFVVPNCVDDPGRRPPDDGDACRRQGIRLVVASRWNAWKGHETLLRAWDEAGCPGTLTILGGAPPLGDGVDVPALVDRLVSDRSSVDIVGEVPAIAEHLARCDALVLPSDLPEPFGLVIIEAFAVSRPAIASRAGGPLEIIEHGETGWFFEPGDWRGLASLLGRLSRPEMVTAGERARRVYDSKYSPPRYRDQIREILRSELSRR